MTEEDEDRFVCKYFEGALSTGFFKTNESMILIRQKKMISDLFISKGYVALFSYECDPWVAVVAMKIWQN